jgi:hypothetical protein
VTARTLIGWSAIVGLGLLAVYLLGGCLKEGRVEYRAVTCGVEQLVCSRRVEQGKPERWACWFALTPESP